MQLQLLHNHELLLPKTSWKNKVTNLSAFWFIGNLTYIEKYTGILFCMISLQFWRTTFLLIQALKSNQNVKFKSIFIHFEFLPFLAFQSKKVISEKYWQVRIIFLHDFFFTLINPDWKIKSEEFNVLIINTYYKHCLKT